MAPKEKKKSKKKSHHQSIRSVPGVIPGTSTLSLPNLGSNFPHDFAPDTPSYSLDLCQLLLESAPNSKVYYDFFIHQPIKDLVLNLLTVHGLSNNAQAVKDYLARIKGQQPSATVSGSVRSIIGDLNLNLQQKQSVMETIYRNYKAAVEYYCNKAEETSKELKELDKQLRDSFLQQSQTFHVIKGDTESSPETDESDKKEESNEPGSVRREEYVDESSLGAVGGAPPRKEDKKLKHKTPKTKEEGSDKSDDDFDDSTLGAVGGVTSTVTASDNSAKDTGKTQTEPDQREQDKERSLRKKKFSNLRNLWEIRSSEGSTDAEKKKSEEDFEKIVIENQSLEHQDPTIEDSQTETNLIENKQDTVDEDQEEADTQETEPDIIVPFHTSQMNIPILRPNVLITSDIGSTSILMTTQTEQRIEDTSTQTQTDDITRGATSEERTNTEEQEDADVSLRLPRPLTDRKEKYPKDETGDEPIVMSPAALGGTSYRITSNIPQMPIGSPRNYQVLER